MSAEEQRHPQELPPVSLAEYGGLRSLHLGSVWLQGSMRISDPQVLVVDYVQRMMAALLWLPSAALGQGRAVQLGLGAGAITRFTAQQLKMATTVVEINVQVVAANQLMFHLPAGLDIVLGDAADYLAHADEATVQLLHIDLYDAEAAAPVLDSQDFYVACRRVLEPGGVCAVNLFGRHASFEASLARIAAAFGSDQTWSLAPTREGNTVVIAGRGVRVPAREELSERAAAIEARWGHLGLRAREWLNMVRPCAPPPDAAPHPPS
jgi:spermidine synthase